MTDITDRLELHVGSVEIETPPTIVSNIWGWQNNIWLPAAITIPTGTSYARLSDNTTGLFVDLSLLISDNDPKDDTPLLAISQGVIIKKDLSVGGFVSANQGVVAFR